MAEEDGFNVFPEIKELNIYDFNLTVAENTRHFLDKIKLYYVGLGSESGDKKDFEYSRLVDSLGRDGVYDFKQKYYNTGLADLVLNRTEINKMIEVDYQLIQKKDPVFMYPESRFGRSHFYAPVKRVGNFYVDTFWFNLAIVWLGTVFLFFTLWSDVLRKVMNYIEGIKLVRREKKRK